MRLELGLVARARLTKLLALFFRRWHRRKSRADLRSGLELIEVDDASDPFVLW